MKFIWILGGVITGLSIVWWAYTFASGGFHNPSPMDSRELIVKGVLTLVFFYLGSNHNSYES